MYTYSVLNTLACFVSVKHSSANFVIPRAFSAISSGMFFHITFPNLCKYNIFSIYIVFQIYHCLTLPLVSEQADVLSLFFHHRTISVLLLTSLSYEPHDFQLSWDTENTVMAILVIFYNYFTPFSFRLSLGLKGSLSP